jgi:tRNA U34 5-methylaminomethyl-2-thiouridine-forming methyltransferase MnmC
LSRFTLTPLNDGSGKRNFTIKDENCGQIMHSQIGPESEALLLYVEPSDFPSRLSSLRSKENGPLVIWDVGMGIASNSLFALERILELKKKNPELNREVQIVSFENALEGIQEALQYVDHFPYLKRNQTVVRTLLSEKQSAIPDSQLHWHLASGDFQDEARKLTPDLFSPELVYFDFYDPKTCPELWSKSVFEQIHAQMREKKNSFRPCLMTYSSSSQIRIHLAQAGFKLGRGPRTPIKKDTTEAALHSSDLADPLPKEWFSTRGLPF